LGVHFLIVIVPVTTPLSFPQLIEDPAFAAGANVRVATPTGTAIIAKAATPNKTRRIPSPLVFVPLIEQ
jgi:hypothetical protein